MVVWENHRKADQDGPLKSFLFLSDGQFGLQQVVLTRSNVPKCIGLHWPQWVSEDNNAIVLTCF